MSENSKNSAIKMAYLITIEDPSHKPKFRTFYASKYDKSVCLDFKGYETTSLKITSEIRTYDEVISIAEENNLTMQELCFPWHRVISIRNVSYRTK